MRQRLRLVIDLVALSLFVCGLAVGLAVFTHNPADPPRATVYPANVSPANLLGTPGAIVSYELIRLLGITVYPFLVTWLVIVLTLVLEGRRGRWGWRLLGWLLLNPALALAVEVALRPSLARPGGLLGAGLHELLGAYLTPVGTWLVTAIGLAGALALAGDVIWSVLCHRASALIGRYRQRRAISRLEAAKRKERALKPAKPPIAAPARAVESKPRLEPQTVAPPVPARAVESVAPVVEAPSVMVEEPSEPKPVAEVPIHHAEPAAHNESPAPPADTAPPAPPPVYHPAPVPIAPPKNDYQLPPFELLRNPEPFPYEIHDQMLRERAVKLEKTFTDFGLNVRVVGINTGPVITQYEVALETGLRLHKVTRLADDLALNLKVPSVRMVAPIPGKDTVGVEIPNEHRAVVRLKEVILGASATPTSSNAWASKMKIPLFLGKDTEGRPLVYDLADMPHLLIAGRTGTGKSVCMNAIILSILMTRRPDEVKMIMIDPKMLELSEYGKIPHLMHPVVKDMKKAEAILAWAVDKMEERYDILSRARVRNIAAYNELSPNEVYRRVRPVDDDERARIPEQMPYIAIFVDELNDLMMTMRKEVEGHIIRLAQKSRAAGIHLVVATQKPTVDVITGLIKSNLPARICFQVSSRSDSRVVLDEMGAEKLLGKGDMLFLQPGTSTILRAQGTYAGDDEISRVVEHLECEPAYARELIQLGSATNGQRESPYSKSALKARDEVYEQAIEVVIREKRGSVSLLQRALGIGYGRAARLIDFMAEDAIVGPYNGSSAREVIVSPEQWEELKKSSESAEAA